VLHTPRSTPLVVICWSISQLVTTVTPTVDGPTNYKFDDQSRRPYSAPGVSLYVSDDPQGSDDDWTRQPAFPDQDGQPGI
jgi:hypothetical protein